jgi:hypothetical protein
MRKMVQALATDPSNGAWADVRLQGMKGEFILFLELDSSGRLIDVPMDSGCTITMVSLLHKEFLLGLMGAGSRVRYCPLKRPLRVTNAEKGNCLYAVGIINFPLVFNGTDGTLAENWFDALVVPDLAWGILF